MKSSSTLSILLVSDIHEDLNSLDELANFCKKSSYVPDYIFNLGDIITIPDGQQDDPKIGAEKEKLITQILSKLEKISENVLYIPGNHDPKSLYSQEPPQLTEKSKNLHMKNVKIPFYLQLKIMELLLILYQVIPHSGVQLIKM